eukprot:4664708-Pleurochrysis_carterae.AAC.1
MENQGWRWGSSGYIIATAPAACVSQGLERLRKAKRKSSGGASESMRRTVAKVQLRWQNTER